MQNAGLPSAILTIFSLLRGKQYIVVHTAESKAFLDSSMIRVLETELRSQIDIPSEQCLICRKCPKAGTCCKKGVVSEKHHDILHEVIFSLNSDVCYIFI